MIYTRGHLLAAAHLTTGMLDALLEHKDECYRPFDQKTARTDGTIKVRRIEPSIRELKKAQWRLNKYIQSHYTFPPYVFAGLKGKDSILNSKFHHGSKYFFTTDMKDFYPTITTGMVRRSLWKCGVRNAPARLMAELVTYKGHLPQGAPTSLIIANLVFMAHVGEKLTAMVASRNIRFTQYVDDLTFSSETDFKDLTPAIADAIRLSGLRMHQGKTNYGGKAIITGNHTSSSTMRPKQDLLAKADVLSVNEKEGLIGHLKRVKRVGKTPRRHLFGPST
jgi:RNA-directed DNA polymerase